MWPMIMMLAGSAVQSGGSIYGASQALKQSKYKEDILKYAADYERAVTEINVERINRKTESLKSSQRAATAASGFQTSDADEINIDTEIQGEIDAAILRSSGGLENLRLRTSGTMARAEGYGIAAGRYQEGFGSLLNTGIRYGNRNWGWESSSPTASSTLLSSGYNAAQR